MADVAECIDKLVATGQIGRKVADEALEFFRRSKAEYSRETGPASADAAAALETAKKMRDTAKANQIAIANDVKRWQTIEKRIVEDPRGRNAALAGVLSKDTLIGDNRLKPLMREQPDHPIFSDGNADYKADYLKRRMGAMLGDGLERFGGALRNKADVLNGIKNFVYERFGVQTGDAAAKSLSDAFGNTADWAVARAKAAGRVFQEREDWRLPQHWTPERVAKFSEAEYVKDHMAEVNAGALKLFDKDTGRYATADRYEDIIKRAYHDIKTEGGADAPFSKDTRTFEFQPGQGGADAWLRLQAKYGVGNEVIASVMNHIDHMARTIALHETFGGHPEAVWAAAKRLVKDDPSNPIKGANLTSVNTLQNTFNILAGRGHPVANANFARIMSATRDLVGLASLRNLPLTIVPSDTAMTFMASNFMGMSGFNVLGHVFDGTLTKDVARHLQISAHGYMDYINNFVRRYEDQINYSGLIRKVSRGVVQATGADLWSRNGRLGWQISMLHQLDGMRDLPFDKLDPATRERFLGYYGFTPADWDKIRASEPFIAANGARYLDTTKLEEPLAERLLMAIREQGSYAFHEPDARTQALMTGGVTRGTLPGEAWLAFGQYKQFAMERMTTHIMRALVDGPIENRVARGLAFALLSTAAGAVSMQAASVIAGKDPIDMTRPDFWVRAFTRGGAGGVYGDVLSSALEGNRGPLDIAAQLGGPIPGFVGDALKLAAAPAQEALGEGKQSFGQSAFAFGKRWTPQTWYTKLAVDRLLWDKMQVLVDPHYRQSFTRAEQRTRQQGSDFWWAPGEASPSRAPDIGNARGR